MHEIPKVRLSLSFLQKNPIFKAKHVQTLWNQSQPFLEIIKTLYNLNPTSISEENEFSEKKIDVLDHFSKVKWNSQNQVQFDSNDVSVGLSV